MNANIDINAIKQYNTSLKQYREQSAKLNAEINFLSNEIDNLCKELTAELGTTVTRDNVEQVCSDLCDKINSNLQSGNAVLSKIAGEANKSVEPQASVGAATPSAQPLPSMPSNVNGQNVIPAPSVQVTGNEMPASTIPISQPGMDNGSFIGGQPTAGSIFGNTQQTPTNPNSLPGFFN